MKQNILSPAIVIAICAFGVMPSWSRVGRSVIQQAGESKHEPTAVELSRDETPAKAIMRTFANQEYEFRAAAEAMPEAKWGYRPAPALFKNEKPEFGPAEARSFREQVKHVACSNFAFAAELDRTKPPDRCDKGGPCPATNRVELLSYLRDSFVRLNKSLPAITTNNMFDPIAGPYEGPNTRLGLAEVCVWHVADHYSQMAMYLRLNGMVPPAKPAQPCGIAGNLLICQGSLGVSWFAESRANPIESNGSKRGWDGYESSHSSRI